ncbi:hypothetical protein DXG01_011417 [Tephrocybe rancida]|nr:hypothetical protein DXG01_011417 [Tephrocybe rancida]
MSSKGVALVTGAGQGIGRAIALRLADDGFDVAVNDITTTGLETLVEEIKSKQRKSTFHVADISFDKQVKGLITDVVEHHGGLDVLVANAGIPKWKPLLEKMAQWMLLATEDDWDKLFAVNAKGTFLCYKYAGAQMVAQGRGGRIIGASSVAGKRGAANMAAYSATKFAIRGLTQSAAIELGPHGITVNAYAPGPIETSMLHYFDGKDAAFFQGKSEDLQEKLSKSSPVGRIGIPADIASLVSYLASKESGFITEDTEPPELDRKDPTDQDVFSAQGILLHFVPLELADVILNMAQYWPCVSAMSDRLLLVPANHETQNNAAAYYLVTPPVPSYQHLEIQMVKFSLSSCDQGWGGDANHYGTYNGSFTWFEAGIIRGAPTDHDVGRDFEQRTIRNADEFDADAFGRLFAPEVVNSLENNRRWALQFNIQVSSTIRNHQIAWTKHDIIDDAAEASARTKGARTGRGFVGTLTPGDRITLIVRAQSSDKFVHSIRAG